MKPPVEDSNDFDFESLVTGDGLDEATVSALEADPKAQVLSGAKAYKEARELTELREKIAIDALTGLPDARKPETIERVEFVLAQAERSGQPVSIAFCDLDHFKRLNDTYGHQAGDEALKAFARALKEETRDTDIPTRNGGEEFLLVLPNTVPEQVAETVLPKIRENYRDQVRRLIEEGKLPQDFDENVTFSAGITNYVQSLEAAKVDSREKTINRADDLLYEAKGNGRNQFAYSISAKSANTVVESKPNFKKFEI